jgi:nucleoside-diphosphate-sugar epimerase
MLVVGGAGFVGSNLVQRVLDDGAARVVVVDNFLSSERSQVPDDPRVELIEGSIAHDAVLAALPEVDQVYHLATFHGNQNSIADPIADHDNNLLTTLKLFERLRTMPRVERVVYAASGCSLAEKTDSTPEPTDEFGDVPIEHDSPYQISKIVGEFHAVYYHRRHGLPTVRARFQNVYGPGEILGAGAWRGTDATVWRNVTPTFIYRALTGQPLRLDNAGAASRDFIHVDDIVEGLLRCGSLGTPGGVYNLASGVETTIRELAERIIALTGSSSELEVAPRRGWDNAGRRYGSTAMAERELEFRAAVNLEEGLRSTVAWTRENLGLIQICIARHAARVDQGYGSELVQPRT